MTMPDIQHLTVYTNRGTLAYPTDATTDDSNDATTGDASNTTGEDASEGTVEAASEVPTATASDGVPASLAERLGTVLFAADTGRNVVRCYFRAEFEQPVQLTAEVDGETVVQALDRLPVAVHVYATCIRDGDLDTRDLDSLPAGDDGRAFAAVRHEDVPGVIPEPRAVKSALQAGAALDFAAPSVEAAVGVARTLATAEDLPAMEVVVSKTVRIPALADADVVVRVDEDVDAVQLDDAAQYLAWYRQRRVRERLAKALNAAAPFDTRNPPSRGVRAAAATELQAQTKPLDLRVLPAPVRRIELAAVGLAGVLAGWWLPGRLLDVLASLATPDEITALFGPGSISVRPPEPMAWVAVAVCVALLAAGSIRAWWHRLATKMKERTHPNQPQPWE